jgi:diguanylate cyclase (GGDEF)-like protein
LGLRSQLRQLEARLLQRTGCTRLCVTLAAIGCGLSAGAAASTYWLLHEPMESVGSAVVQQLAAAKCTAVNQVMAGLSLVRLDGVISSQRHAWEQGASGALGRWSSFGVIDLANGRLVDLHSSSWRPATVLSRLKALGLDREAVTAWPQPGVTPPAMRAELEPLSCSLDSFALHPDQVRIYPIPPPEPRKPGADAAGPGAEQWFAFVYGPWRGGTTPLAAFALVNLQELAPQMSGIDGSRDALIHQSQIYLNSQLSLYPKTILANHEALMRALPILDKEDRKLATLRILPFANQVIVARLSVDHRILTQSSRRAAAGVFLIGLFSTGLVVLVSRASQLRLKQLNKALAEESRTDGLTQMANRRAWDEAIATAESRRRRHGEDYAVVVIDLDGFKQINDRLGHQRGDAVLKQASSNLARTLGSGDLLARVGGDEFAILICRADAAGLQGLLERLELSLREERIQASIGGALSGPECSLEQTWHLADAGMYARKWNRTIPVGATGQAP